MWAAEEGRLDIMGLLLSEGAKVDVQNNQGGSALMWAIYEKKTDAAALMVKAGANTNLQNAQGLTALLMAAGTGDLSTVQMLLAIKGQNRPNVNTADHTGSTALHAACQNQHADIVRLLLQNGALTTVVDRRSFTPLIVASLHADVSERPTWHCRARPLRFCKLDLFCCCCYYADVLDARVCDLVLFLYSIRKGKNCKVAARIWKPRYRC